MKRRLLFLLFILSVISFSCKKDKSIASTPGCTLSANSILGTYTNTAYTRQQSPTSPIVDEYAAQQPCEKDDRITIYADGTYKRVDTGVTCYEPAEVFNGTWSLNGNTFVSDEVSGTVMIFDCHTLVVSTNTFPKETGTYIK